MDSRAALVRGQHLVDLKRYAEALDVLLPTIADDPDDARRHALVAISRLGLADLPGALASGNQAVRCAPDDEWGHRICAIVLDRMGRHEEAVVAAGQAVRLAPMEWRPHEVYASAAVDARGRGRAARAAAERAVHLAPHEPSCHFILGLVAQRFRDDETARAAYRRVLALDPQHAMAINNLAVLDGGMSLSKLARRYGSALHHEPGSPAVLGNVDVLAVRFVRRLYYASILAMIIGLATSLQNVGTDDLTSHATTASVVVGLTLVLGIGLHTWTLVRSVPVGVRRYVRSRVVADRLLLANVVLALVMLALALAVCFVPGGAIVGLGALQPIAFANVLLFMVTKAHRG